MPDCGAWSGAHNGRRMQMSPCQYLRWAEREVRKNLRILGSRASLARHVRRAGLPRMQMSPCQYLRWAEREVRKNLRILGYRASLARQRLHRNPPEEIGRASCRE